MQESKAISPNLRLAGFYVLAFFGSAKTARFFTNAGLFGTSLRFSLHDEITEDNV